MTLRRGQIITVLAETMSRHGDGVALHGEGEKTREIHVHGLFPGELAEVEVEHVSRQRPRAQAVVRTLRDPAVHRRQAPCPHHGTCTGCPIMDLEVDGQRLAKQALVQRRYGIKVDQIVTVGKDGLGYRWSSKRVVGGTTGGLILGSYQRGSHQLADMTGCLVDHPDIVAAFDEVRSRANHLGVVPYDEETTRGDLRHVWARTDGRGNVLLTLVTAEARSPCIENLPGHLRRPAGVAWAVQAAPTNDMRGTTIRPVSGRQSLHIQEASTSFHVGPIGFLQPNPQVAAVAYRDLTSVPAGGPVRGRRALDLYAGAGVTTRLLRRHFEEVIPCESYPESARNLGVEPMLVETFLSRELSARRRVDLAIANPPRGGLGATVCDQLNRLALPRLHIMSCSPQSLRDDLDHLVGSRGAYRLLAARAFDTLPQTPHVEVVAWLIGKP